ncbi:MAG: MGMT family protein [Nanoarchaeota archaeon]
MMPTSFQTQVYSLTSRIPKGKVSTYLLISNALNSSPRAVGQALKCNPFAPTVPCHRVVKSDGSLGGFMGQTKGQEIEKKRKLLKGEGIVVERAVIKDFATKLFEF